MEFRGGDSSSISSFTTTIGKSKVSLDALDSCLILIGSNITTGTLCVESAPGGLLEEPELSLLPTLEALGERIGGCTFVTLIPPERPGDGTEEFGDCTVLFEGGFG